MTQTPPHGRRLASPHASLGGNLLCFYVSVRGWREAASCCSRQSLFAPSPSCPSKQPEARESLIYMCAGRPVRRATLHPTPLNIGERVRASSNIVGKVHQSPPPCSASVEPLRRKRLFLIRESESFLVFSMYRRFAKVFSPLHTRAHTDHAERSLHN